MARRLTNDSNQQPNGCAHYVRRCALLTPCCNKTYPCHVCHNENENHQLDRSIVGEVICLLCKTKQAVGRACVSCGTEFGKYFCEICCLYDDTDKRQFHCNECGICRLHGRHNYFHCPTCDICLHIDLKSKHHCVEKVSRGRCTVCLEDLHSSRESLRVLECGHLLHKKCFKALLRSGLKNKKTKKENTGTNLLKDMRAKNEITQQAWAPCKFFKGAKHNSHC